MRSIDRDGSATTGPLFRRAWQLLCLILIALCSTTLFAQQKSFSVYAPQMYYQVSILDRGGKDYAGLIDLLEPLGRVESRTDGKKWKLRFTGAGPAVEAEFQDGKRNAKIRGSDFDLGGDFVLQGDRGYVPTAALTNVLPRITDRTADLHASARRLFIGTSAMKLSLELLHAPNHLVATFSNPVSPQISSDGMHLQIVFSRDPVVPGATGTMNYSEGPFRSSSMTEANGTTVLSVTGTAPLLAQFSDGGKTLTISAVTPQAPTPTPSTSAGTGQPTEPAPGTPAIQTAPAPISPKPHPRAVVVLDAGHGGDERGAQLTETLSEKDVALALARRIQHELETRGIAVTFLRSGDATLTADQRAGAANIARPLLYVSVHAASLGTGVRVFTAMIPTSQRTNRRAFLPWDSAQAAFVPASDAIAESIATECRTRKLPVRALAAPVRPLNSIAAPAIAVEIAPQGDTVESITDAKYQQDVASAIAAGIAASRGKLEAQ
jgi:N-acetylmuramoyl-L-alanine amidase